MCVGLYERPQRCRAAWRVTPSWAAISAHEYPVPRSPDDGLGDGLVQLGGETGHVGQGVNITWLPLAGRGAYHASKEAAYSSFSTGRRRRFGVNLALTLDRPPGSPAPAAWSAVVGPPPAPSASAA